MKWSKWSLSSRWTMLLVTLAFAGLGSYMLLVTHASTPVSSSELETGSVTAPASTVNDLTASGGKAVKFMATSGGTRSCPAFPSFPDASCTGVPVGEALTVVNGNQTYGSTYNGQTITNKDFHGFVTVTGSNITFKNCFFRGGTTTGNAALLDSHAGSGTNLTVIDSTFAPSNQSAGIDGIWAQGMTLTRVNVSGTTDGIKAISNTTIQDSFIHDMQYNAHDPNQGGTETHNDGIQILEGVNIHITHNNLAPAGTNPNAAIQITQDFGTVGAVTIDSNLLDYGGCTINIAHKPLNSLTGVSITNNHFGRHQGFSGCTVIISTKVTLAAYSGNVWHDTGLAIPPYQQHD